jgi:hypothetical protein
MMKMLCKYQNGAITQWKPRYDGRQGPEKLIESINEGYKWVPDYAGIIVFRCRGYAYTAIKKEVQWVIDGSKTYKVGERGLEPPLDN